MAATDKKELSVYKDGAKRPYFVKAENVNLGTKEEPEFLPDRLAQMESDIEEAKESQGGGSVTGVKMNGGSPISPDQNGVVDLGTVITQHQDISGKVDKVTGKGLSSNDYTDTDKAKVNNLKPVATSGSYNDLTDKPTIPTVPTMDATPTAGNTTHTVSSDGVAAAIAGKANAADVPTKTEMADAIDDALGEAQVTVVPENSVGIINSLGSDSDSDALSAAMGKKLKVALLQILSSLGSYAFPNGKPTLDFDDIVTFSVTKTIGTGLSAAGGDTDVALGDSLEVTIAITNNLYVVDDNSVVVTMGGQPVAGAWNASTMKVTIAAVTGNVVINVPSLTYVQRGLVLHLDGKNGRSVAHRWDSLVNYNSNPLYFKLENCDESNSDYVAGNGTNSKGTAFSNSALTTAVTLLDVGAAEGTIEAAYSHAEIASNGNLPIMHNGLGSGLRICLTSFHNSTAHTENENALTMCTSPLMEGLKTGVILQKSVIQSTSGVCVSAMNDSFKVNGASVSGADAITQSTTSESMLSIFYRRTSNDQYAKYRLYALRVYSVQLTDAERAQNLAIDQKRFNFS